MYQRGDDDAGLQGFLLDDIRQGTLLIFSFERYQDDRNQNLWIRTVLSWARPKLRCGPLNLSNQVFCSQMQP